MMVKNCFSTTHYAVPCPHTSLIAALYGSRLLFRSSVDGTVLRSIQLDTAFAARCKRVKWCKSSHRGSNALSVGVHTKSSRLLLADDETIHIFDFSDPKWQATVPGASAGTPKLANVEFGYSEDEVVVFSEFGVKVTIWSLLTNRGVEIRDPKFPFRGHSFRPDSGHLAILTRETVKDAVIVLAPITRKLENSFSLATVDAQGIEWSPDGRWLITWEAASGGFHALIYTADGYLFKNYFGGQGAETPGLGIRTVAWEPSGKFLAIGGYDNQVHLLSTQNFKCTAILLHTETITTLNASIWQEQIDASRSRSYAAASQPTYPPSQNTVSNDKHFRIGIGYLEFNSSGSLLASRSEFTASTVWIWSLESLAPHSILIHHSPIKSLQWHPEDPECLLIHCAIEDPIIHIWQSSSEAPHIVSMPLLKPGGRTEARWVQSLDAVPGNPVAMLANTTNYALRHVLDDAKYGETMDMSLSVAIEGLGPEDMFDEGNSMDLSPIKLSHEQFRMGLEAAGDEVDDTFDYRRHLALTK